MINGSHSKAVTALALLATLSWGATAHASQTDARDADAAGPSPAASGLQRPSLLGAKPVALDVLEAHRGGTLTLNDMKLSGVVAENQAVNVATGSNTISEGAFANAAGLPLVVQNSGNNVLIQNATIVNVQLK
jgi:hypothetical protein